MGSIQPSSRWWSRRERTNFPYSAWEADVLPLNYTCSLPNRPGRTIRRAPTVAIRARAPSRPRRPAGGRAGRRPPPGRDPPTRHPCREIESSPASSSTRLDSAMVRPSSTTFASTTGSWCSGATDPQIDEAGPVGPDRPRRGDDDRPFTPAPRRVRCRLDASVGIPDDLVTRIEGKARTPGLLIHTTAGFSRRFASRATSPWSCRTSADAADHLVSGHEGRPDLVHPHGRPRRAPLRNRALGPEVAPVSRPDPSQYWKNFDARGPPVDRRASRRSHTRTTARVGNQLSRSIASTRRSASTVRISTESAPSASAESAAPASSTTTTTDTPR